MSFLTRIIRYFKGNSIQEKTKEKEEKPLKLSEIDFYNTLCYFKKHKDSYQALGKDVPYRVFQINTVDFPVMGVAFWLLGTEEVFVRKKENNDLENERLQLVLKQFKKAQIQGRLKDFFTPNSYHWEKLIEILNPSENKNQETGANAPLTYLSDSDLDEIKSGSIDLVYSTHLLEKLDANAILSVLKNAKNWVKKDRGVISHSVNLIDPRAVVQPKINDYDFLQYSKEEWQKISTKFPHNRLRIYDYKKLYESVDLYLNYTHAKKGYIYDLEKITLDKKFQDKLQEEVAVKSCHFVSEFRMFW